MSKRPALQHTGTSTETETSESFLPPPAKRAHLPQFLAPLAIHLVPAKLTPADLSHLSALAEAHGAKLVNAPYKADVVLTAVTARKRLERHMPWEEGRRRWVLRTEWLEECAGEGRVMPYEEYLAVPGLHPAGTASTTRTCTPTPSSPNTSTSRIPNPHSPSLLERKLSDLRIPAAAEFEPPASAAALSTLPRPQPSPPAQAEPESKYPRDFTPGWPIPTSRFAVKRKTPLRTPNEDMLLEFKVIMRSRQLEGEDRSALSYCRAISVLKAYPHRITNASQVSSLPGVGPKVTNAIALFLSTGHIPEAQQILASPRFAALSELADVYTVGPNTARALYARGIRNVAELREWAAQGGGGEVLRMGLEVHEDLMIKIPREEVFRIGERVRKALEEITPGCEQVICGGHRRGKLFSGDVDIVFTHPEQGKEDGLIEKLVAKLVEEGFITHVLQTMHPGHNPFSTHSHTMSKIRPNHPSSHFDTLSKALVVCRFPDGIHRRLDLIAAPKDVFWSAVLGWSGSTQFQRDIRLWANQMGMKFDSSGITRLRDTQPIYVKSEPEIFELLGLEYVPPELRNADM